MHKTLSLLGLIATGGVISYGAAFGVADAADAAIAYYHSPRSPQHDSRNVSKSVRTKPCTGTDTDASDVCVPLTVPQAHARLDHQPRTRYPADRARDFYTLTSTVWTRHIHGVSNGESDRLPRRQLHTTTANCAGQSRVGRCDDRSRYAAPRRLCRQRPF